MAWASGAVFRDADPEAFGFERREEALHHGVVTIACIAAMLGEMKLFQLTKAWLSVGIMTRPAAPPMSEIQELRQQVATPKNGGYRATSECASPNGSSEGTGEQFGVIIRREGRRFRLSRGPAR